MISFLRNACGITLGDNEYVLTGGYFTSQIVSKYSKNGWQEDLPKLKVGRRGHGCSAYTRNDKMVRTELMLTKQEISILF